jgi:hypothetical protein
MIWSFLVLAAAALLAFVISMRSRLLALCTTAAGGLTVAYFFMPPDYSLRVDNPEDYITLLAYGTSGILLTHAGAKRRHRRSPAMDRKDCPVSPPLRRTCTAAAFDEAMSCWDARLRNQCIQVRCGALPLPQVSQPHDDVVRVFSDLIRATFETDGVRGVWLHGVQLPGRQLFFWCVETGSQNGARGMLIAGGPDGSGVPILFPDWPSSVRATELDNGFERVYQVTFS